MTNYILRRLLLMVPTLFGITLVCFTLFQFVPGGPVEQIISKIRAGAQGSSVSKNISAQEVENIKAYLGFDKPAYIRYLNWVENLLRLDLGNSYIYQQPVTQVIFSKMPISLFFGLTSFFLTYLISIPLGVKKATSHGSAFDNASTAIIFTGYVVPGFALGILLIIFFGGGSYLNWFPISGVVSDNYETLSPVGKILDFLHHLVLPMICYMVGEFAFLTMLMKNSLLDELNKDYVRTALVKGLPYKTAVWKHALRNALVPLATYSAEIFTVMFAGSLLIERVFDIDGMGLLFYNSMVGRDYNVGLGIIVLSSLMVMLGRLFSDILYTVVDPRIRFN